MANIALKLILSSLGSVYLEAEFLTSLFIACRAGVFCWASDEYPGRAMNNPICRHLE